MNLFGVSLRVRFHPTSNVTPPTPVDAPSRPGYASHRHTLVFAIPFAFVICVGFGAASPVVLMPTPPNILLLFLGFFGSLIAFVAPFYQRFRYDRIGWYKRYDVVLPELPFEMRSLGKRIVFGTEGITFSTLLTRDQTLAYSEITTVSLDCVGHCLSGVTVSRPAGKPHYGAAHLRPPRPSFLISDNGNGERTRTAMAILRAKAPQATFSGPQWVEEGWVPRLGFAHPTNTD